MERRGFLGFIGFSASGFGPVLIAGCVSDESEPVGIGEIAINNRRKTAVEVALTITKNGTPMLEKRYPIAPLEDNIAGGVTIQEEWMGERAEYEITVTVDGLETETFNSQEFADEQEYPYDCTPLLINIDGSGFGRESISVWHTRSGDGC
ncbi:hypothetical protein GS429_08550 [Natronorubrum sp. JWXQ-INN-674]|uniref:Uncharacterized protein n=1 Tax=Natronorubrum halalkaliphilum TaxID=2691917 RepID=A0A6B0VNG8_9EURY|nr:hypothetical protein [Natronorubrum halalkaliphilum]MXV62109.1 hypothetical protein [Natronorubrum halalkaliphilum]